MKDNGSQNGLNGIEGARGSQDCKAKHPIEQKRELANLIIARVHCPGFHRAEAEKAAVAAKR